MSLPAHLPPRHPRGPDLKVVPQPLEPQLRSAATLPIKARHQIQAAARAIHTLIQPRLYGEKPAEEQADIRREATRFVLQSCGVLPPTQVEAFNHVYPATEAAATALTPDEQQALEQGTDFNSSTPHPAMLILDHFRSLSNTTEPADTIQATTALMIDRYTTNN